MRLALILIAAVLLSGCDVIKSTQLEQAVFKALAEDERTKSYSFEVSHQGEGEVLITGEIYAVSEADIVTEIARSVEGVINVINRCNVEETGSGMMQDTVVPTPFL